MCTPLHAGEHVLERSRCESNTCAQAPRPCVIDMIYCQVSWPCGFTACGMKICLKDQSRQLIKLEVDLFRFQHSNVVHNQG